MAEIKVTKKERFMELKEIVSDRTDLVEFLNHEIELLNKKASVKTPSKTQIENEGLKNVIVNVLTNAEKPLTISEITNADNELVGLSNQKISALLIQLIGSNQVIRTSDKKKAYFSLVK